MPTVLWSLATLRIVRLDETKGEDTYRKTARYSSPQKGKTVNIQLLTYDVKPVRKTFSSDLCNAKLKMNNNYIKSVAYHSVNG